MIDPKEILACPFKIFAIADMTKFYRRVGQRLVVWCHHNVRSCKSSLRFTFVKHEYISLLHVIHNWCIINYTIDYTSITRVYILLGVTKKNLGLQFHQFSLSHKTVWKCKMGVCDILEELVDLIRDWELASNCDSIFSEVYSHLIPSARIWPDPPGSSGYSINGYCKVLYRCMSKIQQYFGTKFLHKYPRYLSHLFWLRVWSDLCKTVAQAKWYLRGL